MAIGGSFSKPGMGTGAQAPLPSGGFQGQGGNNTLQGGSAALQSQAQSRTPNQGMYNGNPGGAYNTGFQGQGSAPAWQQQTNLGRYTPPTMLGGNGDYNSNVWNNQGGYNYNLPGSYGSPGGQGQFAPMPGQFQQYMNPNMMSGNQFGYGNPYGNMGGQGMWQQQQQQLINQSFQNPQQFQGGRGDGQGRGGFRGPMAPSMPPGKDGNPMRAPMPQQNPWDDPSQIDYNRMAIRAMGY